MTGETYILTRSVAMECPEELNSPDSRPATILVRAAQVSFHDQADHEIQFLVG